MFEFIFFLLSSSVSAGTDPLDIKWGGFLDTYYAVDFNFPPGNLRSPLPLILTTQATRHNEFNVNLAFLEAKATGDRIRGRLAFQTGTSVPANYTSEGTNIFAQLIQEAVAGYQVADNLWIDSGIYLSPIGFESWVSRDNWTYTRSLMSDFSPYYHAGLKLSYYVNNLWSVQLNLINGWQNIVENNPGKAFTMQISYNLSDRLKFTYNNFYGLESGNLPRFFNELIAKISITKEWHIAGVVDYGIQKRATDTSYADWYQYTFLSLIQLTPSVGLVARLENYIDREGIIVPTLTSNGFQTQGASLGVNIQLHKNLLYRNELRGLWSKDAVFVSQSGRSESDGIFVSALNLTF